jgi:hypothetical protein
MADIYDQCVESVGEDSSAKDLLRCVTSVMQDSSGEDPLDFSRAYLLIHSAALVFLMQAGFAMLAAGSVRLKNVGKKGKRQNSFREAFNCISLTPTPHTHPRKHHVEELA